MGSGASLRPEQIYADADAALAEGEQALAALRSGDTNVAADGLARARARFHVNEELVVQRLEDQCHGRLVAGVPAAIAGQQQYDGEYPSCGTNGGEATHRRYREAR